MYKSDIYKQLRRRFGLPEEYKFPTGFRWKRGQLIWESYKGLEVHKSGRALYRFPWKLNCTCSKPGFRWIWAPIPWAADVESLAAFLTEGMTDKITRYLQSGGAVYMTERDCFQWLDKKYRISYRALELFKAFNVPIIIATRSDLISEEEYKELLKGMNVSVTMLIATENDDINRVKEPGAPSAYRRIRARRSLRDEKIACWRFAA